MDRRHCLSAAAAGAAALALPKARGADPLVAVLATPGPGSSVSAVPELALRIGADRAEGLLLRLRFTGGGGIAIRDLYSGNAQFGVFGVSAAMNENLAGPRLVALCAVEDRVPMTLVVRQDLKGKVRQVADLRGLTVGLHSNSLQTKTNSQQFLHLLLRRAGLQPDAVRYIAAGQSWEPQAAALRSGVAEALISEEPFGLRMEQEGLGFAIVRIGVPGQTLGLPGEGFLRGALMAPPSCPTASPRWPSAWSARCSGPWPGCVAATPRRWCPGSACPGPRRWRFARCWRSTPSSSAPTAGSPKPSWPRPSASSSQAATVRPRPPAIG